MVQLEKVIDLHTFSITARPNVGSLLPWVSARGAIATQARVNTELGRQGLALLAQGVPVDVALSALLRKDGHLGGRRRSRGSPALWPGEALTPRRGGSS